MGGADVFFGRADLYDVTLGVGGAVGHIAGSLGFTYQFGTTDEMSLPDSSGNIVERPKYDISSFGLLTSVTYAF